MSAMLSPAFPFSGTSTAWYLVTWSCPKHMNIVLSFEASLLNFTQFLIWHLQLQQPLLFHQYLACSYVHLWHLYQSQTLCFLFWEFQLVSFKEMLCLGHFGGLILFLMMGSTFLVGFLYGWLEPRPGCQSLVVFRCGVLDVFLSL